jgi:transcriptional regulator with XRE-family HTH domain
MNEKSWRIAFFLKNPFGILENDDILKIENAIRLVNANGFVRNCISQLSFYNPECTIPVKESPRMLKSNNFNLTEIGKRLKAIRKHLHKTQFQMAKELGISLSHYSKLEIGIGGMSRGLGVALSKHFGVPIAWLLYGEGETPDFSTIAMNVAGIESDMTNRPTVTEDLIAKIIEIIEEDEIKPLAKKIAETTNITYHRALAMLVKEKIRAEEIERKA